MNQPSVLHRKLAHLTRIMHQHNAILGSSWGIITALSGTLLVSLITRIVPWLYQTQSIQLLGWMLSIGTLGGMLLGYLWPIPVAQRLRRFDRDLNLADRLTTAWELEQGRINAPKTLIQQQRHETLQNLEHCKARAAFPLHPSRSMGATMLILSLLLIPALWLPNPQEAQLAQREAQRAATEAATENLEAVRDLLEQDTMLSDTSREAALQMLEQALDVLSERRSTLEEQQTALANLEHLLATLRDPDTEAQIQRLAQAAPLSDTDIVAPLTEALQRGDVEAAATYLRELLDPTNARTLTEQERQALADALSQIADTLQQTDTTLAAEFRDIAEEIYQGDLADAQQAIQQAANALSDLATDNAPNQTLEQAQASVQQAQASLGAPQQPTMAQTPAHGSSGQQGSIGQQGNTEQGNPGTGGADHHEDSGSSLPFGDEDAPRIEGSGDEITLPRPETAGAPQLTTGLDSPARVPYQEVYGDYSEAAEAELSRRAYPPALRTYIREYFSGLDQ